MKTVARLKRPLVGKLNALAVFGAWLCLLLLVVLLVYLKVASEPIIAGSLLVLVLGSFLALTGLHVALSFLVRCPHCNGHLTSQGFATPKAGEWSGPIVKWFTGSVICIHCGNRVNTSGANHDS
jgi:hypothetical protein